MAWSTLLPAACNSTSSPYIYSDQIHWTGQCKSFSLKPGITQLVYESQMTSPCKLSSLLKWGVGHQAADWHEGDKKRTGPKEFQLYYCRTEKQVGSLLPWRPLSGFDLGSEWSYYTLPKMQNGPTNCSEDYVGREEVFTGHRFAWLPNSSEFQWVSISIQRQLIGVSNNEVFLYYKP